MSIQFNQIFSQATNALSPFANQFLPSLGDAMQIGLGSDAGKMGLMGLAGLHPGLAAGMIGLEHAGPFLQKLLDSLPDFSRMTPGGQDMGEDARGRVRRGQGRNTGTTSGAADTQQEISRILNSSMSLEEKIILIAGLVSDSLNGQLEDLLKEQGKLAQNLGGSNASGQGGASFQNVENKIQLLMQRLNRMQTLSSNLLQAVHTTQRAVLSNIRV